MTWKNSPLSQEAAAKRREQDREKQRAAKLTRRLNLREWSRHGCRIGELQSKNL